MRYWALLDDDGKLLEQVSAEVHPCDPPAEGAHPAYDLARDRVVELERMGDVEVETLEGASWQPNLEGMRARALEELELARDEVEARLSPRLAHARKREELGRLELGAAADTLPFLSAEAEAAGESIEEVADRVRAEVETEELEVAKLEARIVTAKRDVRDAVSLGAIAGARSRVA